MALSTEGSRLPGPALSSQMIQFKAIGMSLTAQALLLSEQAQLGAKRLEETDASNFAFIKNKPTFDLQTVCDEGNVTAPRSRQLDSVLTNWRPCHEHD